MVKGITIHPHGAHEYIHLTDLDDYQDIVGGYFEILPLFIEHPHDSRGKPIRCSMYINDSSLIGAVDVDADHNPVASALAYMGGYFTTILGTIVLVGGPTDKGEDTDVPEEVFVWIVRIKRINQNPKGIGNVHTS